MRVKIASVLALFISVWAMAPRGASFTDSMGRAIALDDQPQRIVALAPSLTEILYFLGLGKRVVGVTEFSSYPPEAELKPNVGSYVNLNVEKILSLSPDLVLGTADGNRHSVVRLLEQAGIPVYIVNPRNIREVIDTVAAIGHLCGVPERATSLAAELFDKIDKVAKKTAALDKPLIFLQVNPRPIMTVNKETFSSDLIRLAGGRNMTDDEPITYPRISLEEVIRRGPDVILISSMDRGGGYEELKQQWLRLELIPAARNGRVHLVDSDLIDRPSPRIVQGLEILARHIHPGVQWDE